MRVSLNHLDKVVAAGNELEGRMCRTAQKISVLWLVRAQSGCAVSLLGGRKRNEDAVTPDSCFQKAGYLSVCFSAPSLSHTHNITLIHY